MYKCPYCYFKVVNPVDMQAHLRIFHSSQINHSSSVDISSFIIADAIVESIVHSSCDTTSSSSSNSDYSGGGGDFSGGGSSGDY